MAVRSWMLPLILFVSLTVEAQVSACESNSNCSATGKCVMGRCVSAPAYGTYTGYTNTYSQTRGTCSSAYQFVYIEPEGQGPFPIFVMHAGTHSSLVGFDDKFYLENFLERMAARGFVAVSPQWEGYREEIPDDPSTCGNEYRPNYDCAQFLGRASCMYQANGGQSLIERLQSTTFKASAEKGIVTSGVSQGGFLSVLAGNFHPNVKAAQPIAVGMRVDPWIRWGYAAGDWRACMAAGTYRLSVNQVRVTTGASDESYIDSAVYPQNACLPTSAVYKLPNDLMAMTANSCPLPVSPRGKHIECLRSDGSGWITIGDDKVSDGKADHPYMFFKSQQGVVVDPRWTNPWSSPRWGRDANLEWLAKKL